MGLEAAEAFMMRNKLLTICEGKLLTSVTITYKHLTWVVDCGYCEQPELRTLKGGEKVELETTYPESNWYHEVKS